MPSYSELVSDIRNTSENDSQEFTDQIPVIINKAEFRLIKELDDVALNQITSVTTSVNNPLVSLALDTRIIRNINIKVSGSKINLLQRSQEYVNDYWPFVSSSVGEPKYYAMRSNTQIYLAPTPASAYDTEVVYVARPAALTSAAPNNYFSDFCYDALFYASMVEASLFNKSFNTVPAWQAELKASIDALRNQARRTRQDNMELNTSPAGSANTIIQGSS
jgi:hypothetical protein